MRLRTALLACASLCVTTPVFAQDAGLIADAKAFGARPSVVAPSLSPDGTSVLYITPGPGPKTYVVISNLTTGKTDVVTAADGNPDVIRWCDYAALDRIVCRITGVTPKENDLVGFERLIALDTDGKNPKILGSPSSYYDAYIRQVDGDILDWGNRTDGKLLMERVYIPEDKIGSNIVRTKEGLGIDRVDARTIHADPVEQPNNSASNFMTDGRGNVRIMRFDEASATGVLSGRVKYFYRTNGNRNWNVLADYAQREDQITPLAVDADLNSLYELKKNDGRQALYLVKLDGSRAETLVASNPDVDIDNVVRVGDGMKVIGYTYADESRHAIYFDPEFKALAESLSKALPHLPLVDFVDSSTDGRKLLIRAESDNDPGRYYLFNRDTHQLNEAMVDRPELDGRTLAQVKAVTIPAADGVQIPAYLTLPPGSSGKGLPAVVLPHGGPSARDEWGFDWLPQFLAARGYAVIQPEYRGSTGYGQNWENLNGFKNWRTSMSDIAASAKWLSSQGIADPKRVAIVGWSYGGYAALMDAETDPSLYKAVVAIAPVTDLETLKQDSNNYTDSRMVNDFIGSGQQVIDGSPLKHAQEIQAPVLLAHGDLDTNVRFWHSQKMASALQGDGKQVEFLQYKGLDHQLDDSAVRADLLTHIGALLDRTIGH